MRQVPAASKANDIPLAVEEPPASMVKELNSVLGTVTLNKLLDNVAG